ncbi:MAG: glycosyltransferase [Galactobacter sp.]
MSASTSAPPRTLRIAIVCMHTSPTAMPGSPDAGGMNVVILNTALALAARGHTVDLVTRRSDPDSLASSVVVPGIMLHLLNAGPAEHVTKSAHEELIPDFTAALDTWVQNRVGTDQAPDLLHSEHWFSGVAALPVATEHGLPHVQSFHSIAAAAGAGLDEGEPPESPGRNAGEALAAERSDLVIAVSSAERDTIVERLGASRERIRIVNPGVDTEQFHPLTDTEPRPGREYLLFAARLERLKGVDLAIRTLAAMPEADRPNLVIAGEAAPDFRDYVDELDALAVSLGVAHQVLHMGTQSREDLARLLRGARLLLNPSYSETYGLINLEAAASGVPVIATRAGGMVESVVDGETGVLMTGRDPEDWARAVGQVRNDAARHALMRSAGRAFAREHTWAHAAEATERCYAELLS